MNTTFVDIYTHHVKQGSEAEFQKEWHTIANYFVSKDTAKAATLLKLKDGNNTFMSVTRWPDKASADAGWSSESGAWKKIPDEILQAIKKMKACVDQSNKEDRLNADAIDSIFKD